MWPAVGADLSARAMSAPGHLRGDSRSAIGIAFPSHRGPPALEFWRAKEDCKKRRPRCRARPSSLSEPVLVPRHHDHTVDLKQPDRTTVACSVGQPNYRAKWPMFCVLEFCRGIILSLVRNNEVWWPAPCNAMHHTHLCGSRFGVKARRCWPKPAGPRQRAFPQQEAPIAGIFAEIRALANRFVGGGGSECLPGA